MPLLYGHCHCGKCRKSHGADFTSATIIPEKSLILLEGEDYLATYHSSAAMRRQFCSICGSRLFVRFSRVTNDGEQKLCTVAINSLDNIETWRETGHIYVNHKAPWVTIDDDLPKASTTFPPKSN